MRGVGWTRHRRAMRPLSRITERLPDGIEVDLRWLRARARR